VEHDIACGAGTLQDDGIGVHLRGGQQDPVGAGAEFRHGVGYGRLHAVAHQFERVIRAVAFLAGIRRRIPSQIGCVKLLSFYRHFSSKGISLFFFFPVEPTFIIRYSAPRLADSELEELLELEFELEELESPPLYWVSFEVGGVKAAVYSARPLKMRRSSIQPSR